MEHSRNVVYRGAFVHSAPNKNDTLDYVESGAIGVRSDGVIAFIECGSKDEAALDKAITSAIQNTANFANPTFVNLESDQFIVPGFVDAHIHASQYPNAGVGYEEPLLDWLNKYTYPLEEKYKDLHFAKSAYSRVVQRTLLNGTTFACYWATIHVPATEALADICLKHGQRALIGKVNMDTSSPSNYHDESTDSAIEGLKAVAEYIKKLDPTGKKVRAVITPRFALTSTVELMERLSQLARKEQLPITTHFAETKSEIKEAESMFNKSEYEVYDQSGILDSSTILAHCIYVSDDEIKGLKDKKCGVVHCPISNSALASGICPVRPYFEKNTKLALGTDISGGYSPSILNVIRDTVNVSHLRSVQLNDDSQKISVDKAFFMATLGGARVLGREADLGNFVPGKAFDAQIIDLKNKSDHSHSHNDRFNRNPVDIFPDDSFKSKFEKWIFNGDDRNIANVFIQGKSVLPVHKSAIGNLFSKSSLFNSLKSFS